VKTLIGFLGKQKDARGFVEKRWTYYRPSVGIVMSEELDITKYHLLYSKNEQSLLDLTANDIKSVRPDIELITHCLDFDDAFDLKETLIKQRDFIAALPESEDYLINFTTGTAANHVAWFNLVSNHYIKASLVQGSGKMGKCLYEKGMEIERVNPWSKGKFKAFSLDEARYDVYHQLQAPRTIEGDAFLKQGIETLNAPYNELIGMIEKVAVNDDNPILLTGETGVGKTALATRIYELKKARNVLNGNFVEINCATLRADSAHSVLFGHVKGAFTGALTPREGAVKRADGGVLFLDEIASLSWEVQGMLLRALESKRYSPMGSDNVAKSDFTLICGSNSDLAKSVEEGTFRDDLLARIDLWSFKLPRLRERKEDIAPNLAYELERFKKSKSMKVKFNKEAKSAYLKFALSDDALWIRNFRDLSASMERMGILSDEGVITEAVVKSEIMRLKALWRGHEQKTASSIDWVTNAVCDAGGRLQSISRQDAAVLREVIEICRASKNARTAAITIYSVHENGKSTLSISNPGARLANYLKRYALTYQNIVDGH
jgi:transcriptional regulatory protein RtcR